MSELDTKEFYDNQMDREGIVLSKDQIPSSPVPAPEDIGEMLYRLMEASADLEICEGNNDPKDRAYWQRNLATARDAIADLVSRLRSQVERMKADSERLDALDCCCRAIELRPPHFDGSRAVFRWQVDTEGLRSLRPSVRDAIDKEFLDPLRRLSQQGDTKE